MKIKKSKKAVFYIFDALVFSILLLAGVFLLSSEKTTPAALPNNALFVAKDVIGILDNLKLSDLNSTWVLDQYNDGNFSDLNNSVLTEIGELWANSNTVIANDLIDLVVDNFIPQYNGFGIWVNDDLLFSRTNPPTTHYVSGWRVVSGIEKDKPVKGFVASARATHVVGNRTELISISPEGAGWDAGRVEITKYLNFTNKTIIDALMVLSVHADTNNADVTLDVNNNPACSFTRNDFTWIFGSEGNLGTRNIGGCFVNDLNNFTITLNNNGYNAHTHPGMSLIVNYTDHELLEVRDVDVSKRYYFDNLRSIEVSGDAAGVWTTFPFDIPENAMNLNVTMKIAANHVRDYTGSSWFRSWSGNWRRMRDYDYIMFLNSNTPLDSDNHPEQNPVYNYSMIDLDANLVNGTNIVAVYFNNYGDYVWGDDWVELYSRPYIDPTNSSYVEVNYTLPSIVPYGLIEVVELKSLSGGLDHDKTDFFNYPNEAELKSDGYVHIAQRYSSLITAWADSFNPPTTQIFRSPAMRAVPTTVFVDPDNLEISSAINNFIRVRDDGSGNDVIPQRSYIESRFYVPSYVGYGDVFSTQEEALNDASERLNVSTGTFFETSGITTGFNAITKVPTLWGPMVFEVRVWD